MMSYFENKGLDYSMNIIHCVVNVLSYLFLLIVKLFLLLLLFEFIMVEIMPWTNWLDSAEI